MMELSKRIPARTKTVKFNWCKKDWMEMSERYRSFRTNMKPLDSCYWCRHKFENGEMMAIAQADNIGNKLLCQDCADKCLSEK